MNNQTSDGSLGGPSNPRQDPTPDEQIRGMKEELRRLEGGTKTRFTRMQINQLYTFIGQLEDLAERPTMTASAVNSNMGSCPQEESPHESQDISMIDPQLATDQQLNDPNTSMLANQAIPAGPPLAPDTIEGAAETDPIPAQGGEEPVIICETAAQAPAGGAVARCLQEAEAAPKKVLEMFAEVESIDRAEVGEGTKKDISRFEAIFGHLQDLAEEMTGKEDESAIIGAPWANWNEGHRLARDLKVYFERIMAALK